MGALIAESEADALGFLRRLADELVAEIIAAARGRFGRLRLRTQNPEAARLYEQLGFRRSRRERDCTHVMDLVG